MDESNFDNRIPQQLPVHMRSRHYEFSQHQGEASMIPARFRNRGNFSNSRERFHMHAQHQSGPNMMNNYPNFDMNERHHGQMRPTCSNRYPDNVHFNNSPSNSMSTRKRIPGMFDRRHETETSEDMNNRSQFYPRPNRIEQRHDSYTNRSRDGNQSFVQLPSSPPRHPEFHRRQSNASNSFCINNKENLMMPGTRSTMQNSKPLYSTRSTEHSTPSFQVIEDLTPKMKQKELELDAASILCNLGRIISNGEKSGHSRTSLAPQIETSPSLVSDTQDSLSSNCSLSSSSEHQHPTRLALPKDESELNSLHCFVRQELLEMFIIPEDEDYKISLPLCLPVSASEKQVNTSPSVPISPSSTGTAGESSVSASSKMPTKKSSYFGGRVGFRCVHCAHVQPRPSFICTNGDKKSRVLDPEVIIQNSNAPMATFYPKSLSDLYRLVCTWQRVHFHKCRHIPPSTRNLYHKLKHTDRTRGKTRYWVTSAKEIGLADDPKGGGCVRYYLESKDQ